MIVRDLIKKLQRADPEAEVVIPRWASDRYLIATHVAREGFNKQADGDLQRDLSLGMPKGNFFLIS